MSTSTSRRAFLRGTSGALAAASLAGTSFAQDYPAKDLTIIIPYAPGGMSDNLARILGEKLTKIVGRSIVNDYRSGAGGAIAANYYVGTRPDGYALLMSTNSFYAIVPAVTKVEYDPKTDFTPLMALESPMVAAIHPSVPAKTLQEFIAYAKNNPGKIAFATAGRGSTGHICGEWLARKSGLQLLHIPYNGAPQAMQATVSGEAQLVFGPETQEFIATKKLVGLMTLTPKRWHKLPDVPTNAEAGLPGWAPRSWHTVTILTKAPDAVKAKLNKLLNDVLQMPDVAERIRNIGLTPAIEDLATLRRRADEDIAEYGKVIAEAGLGIGK